MHYILLTAAAATLARLVNTQSIDPNSVPLTTRDAWCNSQIAECPLICLQEAGNSAGTYANTCDPTSLSYACVCSNGLSPNATEYSQTIPYFICTQYNTNCAAACGNDNTCAAACVQDHPCGAQSPIKVNTSTITTMPATSTTAAGSAASTASDGSVVYTGFGGGSAATTTAASSSETSGSGSGSSAASRLIINAGEIYGLAILAAGVFFGFSVML